MSPKVVFLGVLPPPLNGMTVATAKILDYLRQHTTVQLMIVSQTAHDGPWTWRVRKAVMAVLFAVKLARSGPARGASVYLVANARGGLWYTLLHVAVGRLLGYRVYLHHHVFSYVSRRDARMWAINGVMGSAGTHVLLCAGMKKRFLKLYRPKRRTTVLPNEALMLGEPAATPIRRNAVRRLGHISNLSMAKGFDLVLETFAALRDRGHDIDLWLAGPLCSGKEAGLLKRYECRYGNAIKYCGPVSGQEKRQFFEGIDVMLFPTRYRNEAYPLVLVEALHFGVPAIAYARGCIETILASGAGLALRPGETFVELASTSVEEWLNDPLAYRTAAASALRRAQLLKVDAQRKLAAFLAEIAGAPVER